MDFFITKIFEDKATNDELTHLQFQKFSRGEFKGRAVVIAKNSGGKYVISTSAEYGNEFVRFLAEKLGENKTNVSGVIVSTRDLTGELDFVNKKQFMSVKQYMIDKELSGKDIIALCDKLPTAFFGLSFSVGHTDLKIKPKAPKSGKPSTKGEETSKADFCKIKTTDIELVHSLIFDAEAHHFKHIEITHEFIIQEIIIGDELKKEKNFALIREKAQRKGKIVRKLKVDGKDIVKEKEFVV